MPGQVITVQATSPHSVVAVVRTWELESDGKYRQINGPFVADVGVHGVGHTKEGLGRTPIGVFGLTQAFGNQANNGTRLPYLRAGLDDWWDENPTSAQYNEHVRSRFSPGARSENLYDAGAAYAHAVVINYNTDPVVIIMNHCASSAANIPTVVSMRTFLRKFFMPCGGPPFSERLR